MTPSVQRSLSAKVCLLGSFAVGKTSLVRRFVHNRFDDQYLSTIGVKVSRKTVMVAREDGLVELHLLLWDLAGTDAADQIRASYLRGAVGAILVCDLTRPDTAAGLARIAESLRSVTADTAMVMAANKRDLLDDSEQAPVWVSNVADALAVPCSLTSAKHGDEVEGLFRHLGRALVDRAASASG